jgi:putative RecB family exonuclease
MDRLSRIDRVPQRTATWFIQGTSVHTAVAAYERTGRTLSEEDTVNLYEVAWDQEMGEALLQFPDKSKWTVGGRKKWETDADSRRKNGREQVQGYIANNNLDSPLKPFEIVDGEYAVEQGFLLSWEFPDVIIDVLGYIDLIMVDPEGELLVRDLKTGAHEPEDPYQLATYALGAEPIVGTRPGWGDWWMAKGNAASAPMDLTQFSEEDIRSWYYQLHQGISNGVFLGNPGDACFTCMSRDSCPVGPFGRK